jgi:hypothetical protein
MIIRFGYMAVLEDEWVASDDQFDSMATTPVIVLENTLLAREELANRMAQVMGATHWTPYAAILEAIFGVPH